MKTFLKLPDGSSVEIKSSLEIPEPKITTEINLLPRDLEALKLGHMVKFTDVENSVAVCVRLWKEDKV